MVSSIPDDRAKLLEAGPETPGHAEVVQNEECAFLKKLPAELRNQIYAIVAVDHARKACLQEANTLGMALVNRKISSEYLGISNSKETISSRYLVAINPMKWEPLDVRDLIKKRQISRGRYDDQGCTAFRRASSIMTVRQSIYYQFHIAQRSMEESTTNLQDALALVGKLTALELHVLHPVLDAQMAELAAADTECRFLKISAELRNQIYEIVAAHQTRVALCGGGRACGLARVNKQVSKEYLSVLNHKDAISAKYFNPGYHIN
ncbi:hypothetical protein Slin15195_G037380 [Septoria linicola]|uniref:Uncharacterized protein n=1 Tax=Septoria linicola TaxID=215465 RepID=A0A9Q9AJC9_9PEZI|nr:hypothetical protein Slin14017_G118790 [Septoria linicola]USW50419.1 hypothetical protein Slin15195_G037380 [Septoria linicola]